MVWSLPLTIIAAGLHHVFHSNPEFLETMGVGESASSVFGGFNFILGFLVVFRSQQAYSRWWEGGTLLQQLRGEWFNAYSCLVAFGNKSPEKQEEVAEFQQQLVRLFSLLYGSALGQVSQMKENYFELINLDGFDEESLQFLQGCPDKCEVTLQWIQGLIVEAEQKQLLKIAPPILSRVYNELGNGIVNLNNARKIRDFPIPFPLAQMIMVMLMFHAFFTPLVCAATVKTSTWAALLTFVVTFAFWSVLYIATELEMPFGDDKNDLPLREMAIDMNLSLLTMLEPKAQRVPSFSLPQGWCLSKFNIDLDMDISIVGRSKMWNDLKELPIAPNGDHIVDVRTAPLAAASYAPGAMESAVRTLPGSVVTESPQNKATFGTVVAGERDGRTATGQDSPSKQSPGVVTPTQVRVHEASTDERLDAQGDRDAQRADSSPLRPMASWSTSANTRPPDDVPSAAGEQDNPTGSRGAKADTHVGIEDDELERALQDIDCPRTTVASGQASRVQIDRKE